MALFQPFSLWFLLVELVVFINKIVHIKAIVVRYFSLFGADIFKFGGLIILLFASYLLPNSGQVAIFKSKDKIPFIAVAYFKNGIIWVMSIAQNTDS